MLIHIALGDAFGLGYEFMEVQPTSLNYVQHPKYLFLLPGMYTDYTQMSLGNAEVMLEYDDPSYLDFANTWVRCHHRDPLQVYIRHFYDFLKQMQSGVEFIHKIRPYSVRSGAAMRSCVFGLYPSIEKVVNVTRLQAVLTHNSDCGINSAIAVALASHYLAYNLGDYRQVGAWLTQTTRISAWGCRYDEIYKSNPGNNGMECAHAALEVLQTSTCASEVMLRAAQMGGNSGTVCSIASGLASVAKGVEQDWPQHLIDGLKDGIYGRTHLLEVDRKLTIRFPVA